MNRSLTRTRKIQGSARRWATACAAAALATVVTATAASASSSSSASSTDEATVSSSPTDDATSSSGDASSSSSSTDDATASSGDSTSSSDGSTPSHGTSASSGTTAGGSAGGTLMFAPPKLSSPVTVVVTAKKGHLKLDTSKDYVIKMPSSPVSIPGGLILAGGHNVVLIGGQVNTSGPAGRARGLYLKGQTGTVHVEGLRLSGAHPNEGIDLDERQGATVQLENIKVDTVYGSYTTNHADVLQTWAGPTVLKVDRLDGSTGYQGFFLDPGKFGHVVPKSFEFHNTVLRDAGGTSKFLLWQSGSFKISTSGVTVVSHAKRAAAQTVRTVKSQSSWTAVKQGAGSVASPLIGVPGAGYRTPGYAGGRPAPAGSTSPSAGSTTDPGTGPSDTATGAPVAGSVDASTDTSTSSDDSGSTGTTWGSTSSSSKSSSGEHDHHVKD